MPHPAAPKITRTGPQALRDDQPPRAFLRLFTGFYMVQMCNCVRTSVLLLRLSSVYHAELNSRMKVVRSSLHTDIGSTPLITGMLFDRRVWVQTWRWRSSLFTRELILDCFMCPARANTARAPARPCTCGTAATWDGVDPRRHPTHLGQANGTLLRALQPLKRQEVHHAACLGALAPPRW